MIPNAFDYGIYAGVAYRKAFPCHPANVGFAAGGPVEGDVTRDDVF
jgi:hypothetical protein